MLKLENTDRELVLSIEKELAAMEQVGVSTHHVIHGGIYSRTIFIPAGVAIAGAEIKIPTTLVVNGVADVSIGDGFEQLNGYYVLAAGAGRKQIFHALEDTWLTMSFATSATTVEECEKEFTDDYEKLLSRSDGSHNIINITGE